MPSFNNFNDLQKAINLKIKETLETKIAQKIKETESQAIKDVVLGSYTPTSYKRRTSGGIEDISNMHSQVTKQSNNSMILSVSNDTSTNGREERNYDLDEAIVLGGEEYYEHPYNSELKKDTDTYSYLKGRDYVSETVKRLKENGEIVTILKDKLNGK